ncbi:transcription factor bHLH30-like [Phalaenopsis equestris]|uniref:transcription factor bHLH30-like n=1 Tax=Phalaenopsis equestris TaxID=78828 RepID=UPI0009E4C888|nr:transcription factor bHLH30-like [Phalaenopsis equestris]
MKKSYNFSEESKRADQSSSPYNGALLLPMASSISAPALLSQNRDFPPSSSSSFSTDARTVAALRTHSLAEKRRRERINAHLATLRHMTPNSSKMDKASLLARVIEQVRDLNRNAANINKISAIPSEMNRVTVECISGGLIRSPFSSCADENRHIKATLCCNDRPDLFSDLMRAFHILRLTAIRAELTSVGGRAQNVFTLCRNDGSENVCMSSLMESIRNVLNEIASSEDSAFVDRSEKRQRFLATNYFNMTV